MKKDIHPKTYPEAKITCACGDNFSTISTLENIHVEVCSHCHPFFTGKQKIIDTARRVEKFEAKTQKKQELAQNTKYRTRKEKHSVRHQKRAEHLKTAKASAKSALKAAKAALSE